MLLPANLNGIKLAEFKGEIISKKEYERREKRGRGGYAIATASGGFLDCYANAKAGMCKASMANSSFKCFDISNNKNAINNCQIKVNESTVTLYTAPNTAVPPNRELLWAYQRSYKYPRI
jgi:hypothetical protein